MNYILFQDARVAYNLVEVYIDQIDATDGHPNQKDMAHIKDTVMKHFGMTSTTLWRLIKKRTWISPK